MGTEAQPTTDTTTANPTPAAAPPAAASPIIAPPAPPAPSAPEPRIVSNIPTHRLLNDDEEVPTNDEMVALPGKALKSRFDRYANRQLKDRFGVESPEELQTRLAKLSALEKQEEERHLAEMSEVDRERELRTKAEERASTWERRYTEAREAQAMREIDSEISGILTNHFDPMWMEGMVGRLATYLGSKSESELKDVSAVVDAWCQSELTKTPQFGKGYVEKLGAPPAPETPVAPPAQALPRVVVPFSNGPEMVRPTQNGAPLVDKTPAPGRSNSMTSDEWKTYKRTHGIQY